MQSINATKLGLAALFTVVLAGCSSTATDTAQDDTNNISSTPVQTNTGPSQEELERQRIEREALAMTIFYFDFDKSDLRPEAREALVYHANRLRANPNMRVRLEGHADERGTREYNLALGERRAQAIERYLQVQGVPANQLETISYGEERPVATGTSEQAYQQNRRVELVY